MLLGLAGWSGSGKTTLVSNLIPELKKMNISVSTLKHAHEGFDIDKPGKDSYVHRESGAREVLISSNKRFALMHEYNKNEISLNSLIKKLSPVDLILVEGWKKENIKKVEIYRKELNKPLLCTKDKNIIAVATNDKSIKIRNMIILDLNNYEKIAEFIYGLIKKEIK
ncbi:molybdopterin-guanine dinucleotide biosynthesis protein B [Alphaproteobacteria bacterium]|nr:molybdopterin-guanine dinucleotide biosynthesis protein B [Alphaproteobacteria bacterium]